MENAITSQNINPVQMFNAVNAFKSSGSIQDAKIPETSDGINFESNILQNQNVDEIKQFAQVAGEQNLTDSDIEYGLTYGRSVIADYVI